MRATDASAEAGALRAAVEGSPEKPSARRPDPPLARRLPGLRWRHFLVFAVIYLYAFPYFDKLRNANEMPRILQTRAIVDRGVLHIDAFVRELQSASDTSLAPNGHRYPNKAPGPSFLAVPVYALCKLLGITSLRSLTWAFRVTTATLPALLFLPLFYRVSRRFTDDEQSRRVALVAFALGSQAFPYALLFMSHMLATVFVGLGFAFAIPLARGGSASPRRAAVVAGFGCAMAVMMDYQAVMAATVIGLYVLLRSARRLRDVVLMAIGALPPGLALAAYHKAAFGAFGRTGYDFGLDRSTQSGFLGIVGIGKQALASTFILPANGLLVLAPWVLFALVGGAVIVWHRRLRARVGAEAAVCGVIAVAYLAFLSSLLPYMARGGWCVGPRYMTLAMPFIAWLAAAGFNAVRRRPALRILAIALVLASSTIFVVGASTFPHWPDRLANPLYDLVFPLLGRGYAVHSLGTAVGLHGIFAILPLYAFALVAVLWLFGLLQRRTLAALVVVCSLAAAIVLGHRAFPMTDPKAVNPWPMIDTIWEPHRP
ncbi:MAG: hypothetical protein JXP73_01295 [Deltaproteobacteria bacterium]|nr:hypothetical protein [Deltaproteobacteria bacterium]